MESTVDDPDNKRDSKQYHERQNVLTESDAALIKAIVESVLHVKSSNVHECRFDTVQKEDLEEAVKFYKNINNVLDESGKTIRQTILKGAIIGVFALIFLGSISKIKTALGL